MKAVMKSVSPRICEKVANGNCTILVSKTAPKCEMPFKCYIYESRNGGHRCKHCNEKDSCYSYAPKNVGCYNGRGRVIGEFVCDEIIEWQYDKGHQYYVDYPDDCTSYFPYLKCHSEATGLKCYEIENYGKGKTLYGWHISDLKIYGKPKELSEFYRPCSYSGICYSCNRFRPNGTPNDKPNDFCDGEITRPPQSWFYVEEL